MNFKLRYPWAESGRKCKAYLETDEIGEDGLPHSLYLKEFWGEYFRIDECCGNRKMEKIKN